MRVAVRQGVQSVSLGCAARYRESHGGCLCSGGTGRGRRQGEARVRVQPLQGLPDPGSRMDPPLVPASQLHQQGEQGERAHDLVHKVNLALTYL